MGRSVKAMSNSAISIDRERQCCFTGLMAKANLAFDLIKKSCWKHCHVPITSRPAGQLTVIEGNFAASRDIQEVKTATAPLKITVYTISQQWIMTFSCINQLNMPFKL